MRALVFGALFCIAAASSSHASAQENDARRPPNIVFILADDLGWTDLGCQGSKYYETPNIDRLASQGVRLTRYYHSQNCTPTRAALMSGQYAPRTGVYTVGSLVRGDAAARKLEPPENVTDLPLDRKTVADVLRTAGYRTGMFGKWHIGQRGKYHPSNRGFDAAIVSAGKHFNFNTQPKVDVPEGAYLADWLTDQALEFMSTNRERPFFLYLPHFGVHSPYEAKPELIKRFKEKPGVGKHNDPVYAAMIYSVDESVGRVVHKLEELGLSENTLVIFSSDNGGVGGYSALGRRGSGVTDNSPLRAGKGTLYEGGLRVPYIARWPGVIPAGKTCDEPAVHVDLLPTFADVAGARRPDQPLDGVSLMPVLQDPQAKLDRDAIYWHFPGYLERGRGNWRTTPVGMVHARDWKLMEYFEDGRLELYNLRDDVSEKNNLAEQMPDKAKDLQSKLAEWRKKIGAHMPTPVATASE